MDKERREQGAKERMNLTMAPHPLPDMHNFPYYTPDFNVINNYHQMGYMGNIQQMNGYSHPIGFLQENSQLNPLNNSENKLTPKNQNSSVPISEKPKTKPYISYLITTVKNLLSEGKITMKYLKEKTEQRTNGINNTFINGSEYSSSPSIKTFGSSSKSNNLKNINAYDNSKKNGNISEILRCENPICKYIFNSNKDKFKIKIKGLKTQEKRLCKKCCDAVVKGHFCYYCSSIYRDDMSDTAKWVECDFCKKWEHFDCELSKGKRYSTTQELNDVKQYMCPICLNERAEQKNIDNKIQKKLINKKRRGDAFDDQKCKKNQRKDLRNLKSEKCSELLEDLQLIESFKKCK